MFLTSLLQLVGLVSLHTAAQQADLSQMRQLIEHHADVNAPDRKGATPIFYTANLGSVEGARLLLEHGANINASVPGGGTPLHSALLKRHEALSLFLIEHGADVNSATLVGVAPLHLAVHNGMPAVVGRLLEHGANPEALTEKDQSPMTFALLALSQGQPEADKALRLLLDAKAVPDKIMVEVLLSQMDSEKAQNFATALIEAAGPDHELFRAMVESLMNAQAVAALGGTVHSPLLGDMSQSQEKHLHDWWTSQPVTVPFWDGRKLPVIYSFNPVKDPDFIKEADAAVAAFLKKTSQDRLALTPLLLENCQKACDVTDMPEEDVKKWLGQASGAGLWAGLRAPDELFVKRRHRRDKDVYVWMVMPCEWTEHLLFVYRQGQQLTRLADADGWLTEADAFNTDDAQDPMLSSFPNGGTR